MGEGSFSKNGREAGAHRALKNPAARFENSRDSSRNPPIQRRLAKNPGIAGLVRAPQNPTQAGTRRRNCFIYDAATGANNLKARLPDSQEEVRVLRAGQSEPFVKGAHRSHNFAADEHIASATILDDLPACIAMPAEKLPGYHPIRRGGVEARQNGSADNVRIEARPGP